MLIPIHNPRHNRVCVGTSADDEEEDEKEGLEIEEGGLSHSSQCQPTFGYQKKGFETCHFASL